MWFKHRQKALKFQKQHALKGQKLLAQGIALGIIVASKAPCKGKSFINFAWFFKAFALTGRQVCVHNNPGRCPGRALKKVPNFKLHSLFLNFNSCPRRFSSFKSGILFWTGI